MVSQLFGGVGLFLLGVFLMTDGLKTAAGDALRRMLGRLAGRPVKAFMSGAGIAAVAQSSSATTLATIGFVSAGILTFPQAVGIVMGATLGTTTTGWLVAFVGLNFGIGKIAFPLVGLAAIARIVSHGRKAAFALAVAGFGLMFVGIHTLQTGMMGLSKSFLPEMLPEGTFAARILLVGFGILLTVIVQSSAAAVATALAAFQTGMLDLEQGASFIIGASIGTTSTSVLAAIGATTAAKRTALAHILFSVAAGVLAFFLIPPFVWSVRNAELGVGFEFGPATLPMFHSTFTLLAALLLLPGVKGFSRMVERLVPEQGPMLTRHLDASVAEVPEVAVEAVRRSLKDVAAELLIEVERGLSSGLPRGLDRLDVVRAALKETRRFLATVASSASTPDQNNTRVSIIHALDHLRELEIMLRDRFNPKRLETTRLLEPKRTVLDLVETATVALRQPASLVEMDKLRSLSFALAEYRRTGRSALLADSACGATAPDEALHTLDGLRWLDTVAYHSWRSLYHLMAGPREIAEEEGPDRDPREFIND